MSEKKGCLLTGASRGLGLGVLRGLAVLKETVSVCVTARSDQGCADLESELHKLGLEGHVVALDVCDRNSIIQFCQKMDALFPQGIGYFINNAGVTEDQLLLRMSDEAWDRVLQANLSASMLLTRYVLRGMLRKRFGRLIHMSSVSAAIGTAGQSNYAASKAGLEAFSRSIAREVASRGITSNCIAPGFIETGMSLRLTEAQKNSILTSIPMGKMGSVEAVVHAVLYLMHRDSGYVTGSVMHVNGGLVM